MPSEKTSEEPVQYEYLYRRQIIFEGPCVLGPLAVLAVIGELIGRPKAIGHPKAGVPPPAQR
jgi:hypothetical protein